jgi:sterol desaturase/sphingolipid hydroxylase (fatty acid hydroxylase superfamily)
MRHHFQDHRYGFGVSSPLWDVAFHTLPKQRKKDS